MILLTPVLFLAGDYVENILTPDDVGTEMDLSKFKSMLDLTEPILAGKLTCIFVEYKHHT